MRTVYQTGITYDIHKFLNFSDTFCPDFTHFKRYKSTKIIPLKLRIISMTVQFTQLDDEIEYRVSTLAANASLICLKISPLRGAGTVLNE
jgi:hypothetical protein